MKFKINTDLKDTLTELDKLNSILKEAEISQDIIECIGYQLNNQVPKLKQELVKYFNNSHIFNHVVPIFIYNEQSNEFAIFFARKSHTLEDEPGEEGSVLSYVRSLGGDEYFLNSDCYGQLSCSSCAVELLYGSVGNPEPREEEYDMLDIDDAKPATEKSRLSCQLIVGDTPLVLKIRAPQKILSKVL